MNKQEQIKENYAIIRSGWPDVNWGEANKMAKNLANDKVTFRSAKKWMDDNDVMQHGDELIRLAVNDDFDHNTLEKAYTKDKGFIQYVNTGDTYSLTFLFSPFTGKIELGSYGDMLEELYKQPGYEYNGFPVVAEDSWDEYCVQLHNGYDQSPDGYTIRIFYKGNEDVYELIYVYGFKGDELIPDDDVSNHSAMIRMGVHLAYHNRHGDHNKDMLLEVYRGLVS